MSDAGQNGCDGRFKAVAMVASLGGLDAITAVLAGLPATFQTPVVVLQHGRQSADAERLTRLLAARTVLPTCTAGPGLPMAGPGVVVVPTGWDVSFDSAGRFALTQSDGLHGGDALLAGLARLLGPAVIGVVLTGMQRDGALGVQEVKRRGGRVLVQDPATARAAGMPSAAVATGCVDFVLPLDRMAAALVTLTMAPGGADLLTVPTSPWARLPA